jgi:hypothetical protein
MAVINNSDAHFKEHDSVHLKGNEDGNNIFASIFILNEYVTYLNSSDGKCLLAAMTSLLAMLAQFSCVSQSFSTILCEFMWSSAYSCSEQYGIAYTR